MSNVEGFNPIKNYSSFLNYVKRFVLLKIIINYSQN